MSEVFALQCDGCKRVVIGGLPKTWTKRDTWDNGSVTLHYCGKCSAKGKA